MPLVLSTLANTLGVRTQSFNRETALLGQLPELDSAAVIALISELEHRCQIRIEDDEINADLFATVGSLCDFIAQKRGA